jgi:alkylhydroperoxidase family enzyme
VDLAVVSGAAGTDAGIEHGAALVAFTEAAMGTDDAALQARRRELRRLLGPARLVDVAAIIGAFNVVDRIADATGIPLDDMMREMSADLRRDLDLGRFASAANTPGAR